MGQGPWSQGFPTFFGLRWQLAHLAVPRALRVPSYGGNFHSQIPS